MKINISFDIDTDGLMQYDCENRKDLNQALQNIGSVFSNLHSAACMRKLEALTRVKDNPKLREALSNAYQNEMNFVSQIFNNWKIEGELKNGEKFKFTHKDPGYREELTWQP